MTGTDEKTDGQVAPVPSERCQSSRTRAAKIARLPAKIREELNYRRLHESAPAKGCSEWINGLPEVKALVHAEFEGQPVNKDNLKRWRHSGFQEWLRMQQAFERVNDLSEHAAELVQRGR